MILLYILKKDTILEINISTFTDVCLHHYKFSFYSMQGSYYDSKPHQSILTNITIKYEKS